MSGSSAHLGSGTYYGKQAQPISFRLWLTQRLTGLLIGPLVLLHILMPGAPYMPWLGALLLLTILVHGWVALRRVTLTRGRPAGAQRLGLALSIVLLLFIAIVGGGIVLSLV